MKFRKNICVERGKSGKLQSGKLCSITVPHKRGVNYISNIKFLLTKFLFLALCMKLKEIKSDIVNGRGRNRPIYVLKTWL